MRWTALLLTGCLFAPDVYRQRLDELDDDDADGWSTDAGDCDDLDALRFPTNPEVCDAVDNDCDDVVDEAVASVTAYADADGDGFGDELAPLSGCDAVGVANSTDCDDARSSVHPGAAETCDGADEDCDGEVDDHPTDAPGGHHDADGDGFGDPNAPAVGCDTAVLVDNSDDCDDADDWVYPDAPERLDGVANDCTSPPPTDELTTTEADVVLTGGAGFGGEVSVVYDFTGDGAPDVAIAENDRIFLAFGPLSSGVEDGSRLSIAAHVTGLVGGPDMDGDGVAEIAVGLADGIALVDGDARGALDPGPTLTAATQPVWWDGVTLLALGPSGLAGWSFPVREGEESSISLAAPTAAALIDLDGDGDLEVVLGIASRSAVLIFDAISDQDEAAAVSSLLDPEATSEFGFCVGAPGDMTGDGLLDLVVGAPGADGTGTDDGRAYVFAGEPRSFGEATGYVVGRSADARAGMQLLLPGDTDGDDIADVWIAGPGSDTTGAGPVASLGLYLGPIVGRTEARARGGFILAEPGSAFGTGLGAYPEHVGATTDLLVGAPGQSAAFLFQTHSPR